MVSYHALTTRKSIARFQALGIAGMQERKTVAPGCMGLGLIRYSSYCDLLRVVEYGAGGEVSIDGKTEPRCYGLVDGRTMGTLAPASWVVMPLLPCCHWNMYLLFSILKSDLRHRA